MKQYRITTENIPQSEENDCILPPGDIAHEIKAATIMNGLGANERIHNLRALNKLSIMTDNRAQIQREKEIQPGTEEWFKLWFSPATVITPKGNNHAS